MSRLGRVTPSNTVFLLCDVQEKFRNVLLNFATTVHISSVMVKASSAMGIPVIVTEQYSKGLGHTVAEIDLKAHPQVYGPFDKTLFSMYTPEVRQLFAEHKFENAVIFGLETHVCVQQTVLDLLPICNVHVLADGVSSQRHIDREVALGRMAASGAFVTTSESMLMELIRGKDSPHFKDISGLIKIQRPEAKY
eukprot:c5075_g1_i1.p1 GENE.c5075_g1_i1~~c5075_g1_i1.p1  ORF type:complete len:215 (-),score=51.00 c5075_g1_i1:154-732(-)